MRILLVEDNARLASLVTEALRDEGFAVDWAATLDRAEDAVAAETFDLLLLDLGMPDGDGIDFIRARRRAGQSTPILVITARSGLDDRVIGLDSGADDYLVKPFQVAELAARCRALLRRPGACLGTTLTLGNLEFDTVERDVRVSGRSIRVTPRELDLLERLMRRAGRVVSKEQLEQALYSLASDVTPNALEAVVSRLRRRLAAAQADVVLHAAHGIGYILMPRQTPDDDGA